MKKSITQIFSRKIKNSDLNEINRIKIDLRDLTKENIKYILNKPKNIRTNEDIAYLKNFCLKKTTFPEKLIEERIDDLSQEMLTISSMINSFYSEMKQQNKIICDINQEVKYFYIILTGKVSVYDIEKIDCEKNGEEYYKLILNYRDNKEFYLLEKTLKDNKVNLPIDFHDVRILDKILLKIYISTKKRIKAYKDNPNFLDIIFNKLNFKYSDFGILSYEEILSKENINLVQYDKKEALGICRLNEEKILEKINLEVPDNLVKKYLFLIKTPEIPISYYRYTETKTLNEYDFFDKNSSNVYKSRIISKSDNLELLIFETDIFNEYISKMKAKYSGNRDQFLLNNFFFSSISKITFEKVYLKFFEYVKYYSNQIIIKENDPINYIYFIKSGNVRIYSKRSIIQNHLLIQLIINILEQKSPSFAENNQVYIDYLEIKCDFDKIKEEMDMKKDIHIMNYIEKQCIGFECFYFGFNSLYTAVALSEKVELYRLPIDKLYKILAIKNKKALYEFAIQSEKALKILLDRLIIVNKMLVVKYTKLNKNMIKEASDMMEREIILNQKKFEEMKGNNNIKNIRIKAQKILDQKNFWDNGISNNNSNYYLLKENHFSSSCPKRENAHIDFSKQSIKKNSKFNKNKLLENVEPTNNIYINKFYNFGFKVKLFDYKENLIKQKNRELMRESMELERLSNEEKRQINHLKKLNRISSDFVRLSKGEKRIFISSRNNSGNLSAIKHHYCLRKKKVLTNRHKMNTMVNFFKDKKKREFIPKLDDQDEQCNIKRKIKWIEFNKIKETKKNGA